MLAQISVTTIKSDLDVVAVRSTARAIARKLGFDAVDQARIATTVSELARNIFLYAGCGQMTARRIELEGRKGIEFEFKDQGPGILDIDRVFREENMISHGMGLGLPGARRLMDEFEVNSQVGIGTTITCRKWCMSGR